MTTLLTIKKIEGLLLLILFYDLINVLFFIFATV